MKNNQSITLKQVKEIVSGIIDDIEQIYDLHDQINCGGCGVFAYYFLKYAEKFKVADNFKMVYLDDWCVFDSENEIVSNIKNVKNDRGLIVSTNHVMVSFTKSKKPYYIDGTWFKQYPNYLDEDIAPTDYSGKVLTFKIKASDYYPVIKANQWSDYYNRNKWNPIVKKIISQNFEKVLLKTAA